MFRVHRPEPNEQFNTFAFQQTKNNATNSNATYVLSAYLCLFLYYTTATVSVKQTHTQTHTRTFYDVHIKINRSNADNMFTHAIYDAILWRNVMGAFEPQNR